jgi:hypothetical protein
MRNERQGLRAVALGAVLLWGSAPVRGETNAPAAALAGVNAAAVLKILKADYVDHARLDDAAVQTATISGLLAALGPGAVVVPRAAAASNQVAQAAANVASQALARAEIIQPDIAYLRLADVSPAAVTALDEELKKFATAKVMGFILDLRFADGTNYEAAAAVAGRFYADGGPLFVLKTAGGPDREFAAPESATIPVLAAGALGESPLLLLVNRETRGSAEALAGALRARDRGILIGSPTAGAAAAWKDVPLTDHEALRVATAKIVLTAAQTEHPFAGALFPKGLPPDIAVPLALETERAVLLHPATNLTLTASLQPRSDKKRLSEADLVKAFRGEAVDEEKATGEKGNGENGDSNGEIQEVKDTVLQRAVDVLKGIRMLLSSQ